MGGRGSVAEAAGDTNLESLADLGADGHAIAVGSGRRLADGTLDRVVAVRAGEGRLLSVDESGVCDRTLVIIVMFLNRLETVKKNMVLTVLAEGGALVVDALPTTARSVLVDGVHSGACVLFVSNCQWRECLESALGDRLWGR